MTSGPASDHAVGVEGGLGNLLPDFPVLDQLAGVDAKNVDDGQSGVGGVPPGVGMDDDQVAISHDPLHLRAYPWEPLPELSTPPFLQAFARVIGQSPWRYRRGSARTNTSAGVETRRESAT
jgi:hypothetical protein